MQSAVSESRLAEERERAPISTVMSVEEFTQAETNGDGVVPAEEFAASAHPHTSEAQPEEVAASFEAIDSSHDDILLKEEYEARLINAAEEMLERFSRTAPEEEAEEGPRTPAKRGRSQLDQDTPTVHKKRRSSKRSRKGRSVRDGKSSSSSSVSSESEALPEDLATVLQDALCAAQVPAASTSHAKGIQPQEELRYQDFLSRARPPKTPRDIISGGGGERLPDWMLQFARLESAEMAAEAAEAKQERRRQRQQRRMQREAS
ncbi:unnamed protein product [Symbiodinium sp. CCMP2592]|nr:unnamed protein product [Symbiodinium sp. CCMP2592]